MHFKFVDQLNNKTMNIGIERISMKPQRHGIQYKVLCQVFRLNGLKLSVLEIFKKSSILCEYVQIPQSMYDEFRHLCNIAFYIHVYPKFDYLWILTFCISEKHFVYCILKTHSFFCFILNVNKNRLGSSHTSLWISWCWNNFVWKTKAILKREFKQIGLYDIL